MTETEPTTCPKCGRSLPFTGCAHTCYTDDPTPNAAAGSAPVPSAQPEAWQTRNAHGRVDAYTSSRSFADRWRELGMVVEPLFAAPAAAVQAPPLDDIQARMRRDVVPRVLQDHEARPMSCKCGAQIGDSIDRTWHLANRVADAVTAALSERSPQ